MNHQKVIFREEGKVIYHLTLYTRIAYIFPGDNRGSFTEEIALENVIDRGLAEHGYIQETQIRILRVDTTPNTGAWMLGFNEDVHQNQGILFLHVLY